jgi:hypothetical protein
MTSTANDRQPGGDHYKTKGVQHWDLMADYKVPYLEGNASKYGYRWPKKNGLEDLEKFGHYVEKVREKHLNEDYRPASAMSQNVWWEFCIENGVDELSYLATLRILTWKDVGDLDACLYYIKKLVKNEQLRLGYSG